MEKFRRKDRHSEKEELWLRPGELVSGPRDGFYTKLESVLTKLGFTEKLPPVLHRFHRLPHPSGKPGGIARVSRAHLRRYSMEESFRTGRGRSACSASQMIKAITTPSN